MRNLIMTLLTLLCLSASSCGTLQTKIVCAQLERHEIKPVKACDISFKFNRCRCRDFDFNKWEALSAPVDLPLEACEGISGFYLTDAAVEIRPQIKALSNLKDNLCQ